MESPLHQDCSARFIGTIERFDNGWRVSFRLRLPSEFFAQHGKMEVFATELEAMKWPHNEAAARGFSSIEIQRPS